MFGDAQPALHLGDALLGRRDGSILEVDEVVAALLGALRPFGQAGHEAGEGVVLVGRLLGLAADDQGRARLVDQDVVDLVDDREALAALDPLAELGDHVVAQVVEAELVVRAVGHVGGVGLAPLDRAQVDQALVAGGIAGLEHEARVVGDHPQADPQEVEDRAHPLRVAPGQVVVGGDDVDAPPGQRVEDRRQRRDEGLALAGAHLGDLALVEDDATDQLDIEMAHPQGPLHRLADHREDLGDGVVQGGADPLVLALAAGLGQLAAALPLGVVELVVARLVGHGDGPDLVPERVEARPDLRVGQRLELGFERVGLVDQGLNPPDFPVVGVNEPVEEAENHGPRV